MGATPQRPGHGVRAAPALRWQQLRLCGRARAVAALPGWTVDRWRAVGSARHEHVQPHRPLGTERCPVASPPEGVLVLGSRSAGRRLELYRFAEEKLTTLGPH